MRFLKVMLSLVVSISMVVFANVIVCYQFKDTAIFMTPQFSTFRVLAVIFSMSVFHAMFEILSDYYRKVPNRYKLKDIKPHLIFIAVIFFLLLRNFTIITDTKIYQSSIGTGFLTIEYDYSHVTEMEFSVGYAKSSTFLRYCITFDGHKVDLCNGETLTKESSSDTLRDIYNNIKRRSSNVKIVNNVSRSHKDILKKAHYISSGSINSR